jgi:hypothetical protein
VTDNGQAELSAEQVEAVTRLALAVNALGEAMAGLEQVGLEMGDALRAVPTGDGGSLFDSLPPAIRMMI